MKAALNMKTVDSVKKQGWDFVKVHDWLAPGVYRAIAAEAKRRGLPLAGHVPLSLSATEGSTAGQKSVLAQAAGYIQTVPCQWS